MTVKELLKELKDVALSATVSFNSDGFWVSIEEVTVEYDPETNRETVLLEG